MITYESRENFFNLWLASRQWFKKNPLIPLKNRKDKFNGPVKWMRDYRLLFANLRYAGSFFPYFEQAS